MFSLISQIVGQGLSNYGAMKQADAATDAAKVTSAATLDALKIQQAASDQARADMAPWRDAGAKALTDLSRQNVLGAPKFDPFTSPEFKGSEELMGPMSKAEADVAGTYASTKFGNHLQRYYDSLRPKQSLAGVGQSVTSDDIQRNIYSAGSQSDTVIRGGGMTEANVLQSNVLQNNMYADNVQSAMDVGAMRIAGAI